MRRIRRVSAAALITLSTLLGARPLRALAAAAGGAPPPAASEGVTAFVNVNLVPMDREGVLPGQTVVVRKGRIAEVGPADRTAVPDGAAVIDGSGKYLLPGLTDAHIHLDPLTQPRPDFGDGALYLAYGVTTVFNLRGGPEQLDWRRRIRAGELLAPNLYTSGEFVNEPRVRTPEEVQREVERQAREGYDVIKYHQVVDDKTWEYLTTTWLPRPSYFRMNETARRLRIPLLGHGPYNLGLDAVLEARQSLAHVGEFNPLYFFPARRAELWNRLTAAGLLVPLGALLCWGAAAILRRLRRRPAPDRPAPWRLVRRTTGWMVLAAFAGLVCLLLLFPGGLLTGKLWLLLVFSALGVLVAVCAATILGGAWILWRTPGGHRAARVQSALMALAAVGLAVAAAHWIPISWRSTDASIERLARACRDSGIWVQSTLVVYETGFGVRDGYRFDQLVGSPTFRCLPPAVQKDWGEPRPPLPGPLVFLLGRYPQFTRKVLGALSRAGVPIMAGTDAMGMTLVMPGDSLHKELALLVESGLTPYQAIRAATAAPAQFLGRQDEFGTVEPGKRADLLLVGGDPLKDVAVLREPAGVMVRGTWLPKEKLREMLGALAAKK